MAHIKILSKREKKSFDSPPNFEWNDKNKFFRCSDSVEEYISRIRSEVRRVGFIIQYGYFISNRKFFYLEEFKNADVEYVIQNRDFKKCISMSDYDDSTRKRHRIVILEMCGWKPMNKEGKNRMSD
jgi:hypothetical protein